MNLHTELSTRFKQALAQLGHPNAKVPLSKSTRPEFGEYQFNGAMGLAKTLNRKPRDIAQDILDAVDLSDLVERTEIAGPGFINIYLSNDFLSHWLNKALLDERLDVTRQDQQTVVVDYSSPNLAKEMHVGHLRSTIIGDASVKVLEFLGHHVLRQNHMGDWGTQFGARSVGAQYRHRHLVACLWLV